jgi:xylitol oxidase
VSLFTDWTGPRVNQVWIKARVGAAGATTNGANGATGVATGPEGTIPDEDPAALEREARAFTGSRRATAKLHPVARLSAEPCTEQLGIIGPWHERLPHFRMDFTPASGAELQTEYFVAREHAVAAFRVLDAIRDQIAPLLIASEVRSIAADDLWMSTAYGRDSVAFHFSWILDWPPVAAFLPTLEKALAPFNARPHWGKLFLTSPGRLRALYPRFDAFKALAHELDPGGKFRNAYLDRTVFGSIAAPETVVVS